MPPTDTAEEHVPLLLQDAYGDGLRAAIGQVAEGIGRRDAAVRTSAPGTADATA